MTLKDTLTRPTVQENQSAECRHHASRSLAWLLLDFPMQLSRSPSHSVDRNTHISTYPAPYSLLQLLSSDRSLSLSYTRLRATYLPQGCERCLSRASASASLGRGSLARRIWESSSGCDRARARFDWVRWSCVVAVGELADVVGRMQAGPET